MTTVIFAPEHPVTVVLTDKATGVEVDRSDTTAESYPGCLLRLGIMWNALSVSGGVRWVHPTTGQWYPKGLAFHIETTHPETGELVWVEAS